jgi:S1-C subfamily serine protease
MPFDFTTAIMQATVPVSQNPGGPSEMGTGLLVSDPAPDGTPRIVLVTARHVIKDIGGDHVQLGLHRQGADGAWRKVWQAEPTQDGARSLWTSHPVYDIAVLPVTVPDDVAAQAIPAAWFADRDAFARQGVLTGDAVEVAGYPFGYASDPRGFAILRVGRLASYPLTPATEGTFLIDFAVFSGNSGGPVFISRRLNRGLDAVGALGPQPDEFIAGILTQQILPGGQSINLGLAVHAMYVRQTLERLDAAPPPQPLTPPALEPAAPPASP